MANTQKARVVTAGQAWHTGNGSIMPGVTVADITLHEMVVEKDGAAVDSLMPTPRMLADGLSSGRFTVERAPEPPQSKPAPAPTAVVDR